MVVVLAYPVKEDWVEVLDRGRRVGVPDRPPHARVGQLRAQRRRQRVVQFTASMCYYLAPRSVGKALPEVGVCAHDPMLSREEAGSEAGNNVGLHSGIRFGFHSLTTGTSFGWNRGSSCAIPASDRL